MKRLVSKTRRGATLIEFAFVVPVLLLIMLGIMEFGWYARTQLAVANATREGARIASIGVTQSEIKRRVINGASPVILTENDITLQYSSDSGGSYTPFPPDNTARNPAQNGVPSGNLIRVAISTAYSRLVNLPITPNRIQVQVSIVRERS